MNTHNVILYDYSPIQRAAHLAHRFDQGQRLSIDKVATEYGLTESGAHRLLDKLSNAIPIVRLGDEWMDCWAATS